MNKEEVLVPLGSDYLNEYKNEEEKHFNAKVAEQRKETINQTLEKFDIQARIKDYIVGPSITRYNLEFLNKGAIKKIADAISSIQINLGGLAVRYDMDNTSDCSPGLEVGNKVSETVGLKDLYEALPDAKEHPLAVPLGKKVNDEVVWIDLNDAPHVLIGGTTGSGKSIFLNNLITTLLMRNTPEQLRFLLFDPKHVELNRYRDEPHLLCPIVKDANEAVEVLNKLLEEMEERYSIFAKQYCCNITEYNEEAEEKGLTKLPYIVVIIDEFADLVDCNREISAQVLSLAQKSRAAGIHLVVATQRPTTKVVTGALKANMPTKIAFMMSNMVDSVTMLGETGAEKLLGKGDMFVQSSLVSHLGLIRLQGSYIKRDEIMRVVDFHKEHFETKYNPKFLVIEQPQVEEVANKEVDPEEERYLQVRSWVILTDYVSISRIQRECSVGFNRAARYLLRLQQEGIVGIEPTKRGYAVIKKD